MYFYAPCLFCCIVSAHFCCPCLSAVKLPIWQVAPRGARAISSGGSGHGGGRSGNATRGGRTTAIPTSVGGQPRERSDNQAVAAIASRLANGSMDINKRGKDGNTLLMVAASKGHVDVIYLSSSCFTPLLRCLYASCTVP
jgi:hypothetical protein